MRSAVASLLIVGLAACAGPSPTSPAQSPSPVVQNSGGATPVADIQPGTLTFDDLRDNGAAISSHQERGFTIQFGNAEWTQSVTYGNPHPFVLFKSAAGSTVAGSAEVTGGGQVFRFDAIDVYSSTTKIPYTITGLRSGAAVFTMEGVQPNTFGRFATISSTSGGDIDTLRIVLTNPAAPCCNNPMGFDNLVLR